MDTKSFYEAHNIPFSEMKDADGNPVYVVNPDLLTEEQESLIAQHFKLHKDDK